jgi:nitrogen fixation protein NifB
MKFIYKKAEETIMPVTTFNNNVSCSKKSIDIEKHPCFNESARHTYARIHLPVAPRCNVQCKFCNRKYSCVNESRPGVTAAVMTPEEALEHLKTNIGRVPHISVAGIAGPGDPFANPKETIETLTLIRKKFPDLMLCVSSNGLNILPYVDELKKLIVSHVTITVNAVNPQISAQIYEWINYNEHKCSGTDAADVLWGNKKKAIKALSDRGILVKINTVCIPGVNAFHVEEISNTVADLGASLHNIIPLLPTANTAFASIAEPSAQEMEQIRLSAQRHLPQMKHCARCRSDAVGLLGEKNVFVSERPIEFHAHLKSANHPEDGVVPQNSSRPYIAIASREGLFVNMHLGECEYLRIYKIGVRKSTLVDIRKIPQPSRGCGNSHWTALAEILKDCHLLLASGIGPLPRSILSSSGIKIKIVEDYIQDILPDVNIESDDTDNEKPFKCGASCSGTKNNCNC